tara:strand:+ start:2258 stop:2665 length:408 start_codon:yes stop_codon:yes gene_type:complete
VAKAFFFEAQTFGAQEAPDRLRVQLDAVCRKLLPQLPYRPVRPLGNQPMNQIPVRLKTVALMTAILTRRGRAGLPLTLAPANDSRDRYTEPGCDNAAAGATCKSRHDTLAKIKRVRSNHDMLASSPSLYVESEIN